MAGIKRLKNNIRNAPEFSVPLQRILQAIDPVDLPIRIDKVFCTCKKISNTGDPGADFVITILFEQIDEQP